MNDELLRVLISETVHESVKRVRGVKLVPGTIIDGSDPFEVQVSVDGDSVAPEEEEPIDDGKHYAQSIAGPLPNGERVMLMFYPPSGCLIVGTIIDYTWQTPTFANGWVDHGSPNQTARFRREPSGVVRLQGLIKNGTIGLSCFTLPEGYRPPADLHFASNSNGAFGSWKVGSNGVVLPQVGSNVFFELNQTWTVE